MSRTTTSLTQETSSSTVPTIPDENDEHTLEGFGDISLSDNCFIPGVASDLSPRKKETIPRGTKKPPTLHLRPGVLSNRPLPPLMAKALRSPTEHQQLIKATLAEPKVNFKTLIDSVRLTEEKMSQNTPKRKGIPSPIAIFKRGGSSSPAPSPIAALSPKTPKTPKPMTPRTPKSPTSPQSPKPWRGNSPLPKRLPLPTWDLLYPELEDAKEKENKETQDNVPEEKVPQQKDVAT
ncbi:uncharacterized protein BT62DRAFT_917156 [Guyanagaster necrorhizus]|uniref:Uncharacterized protein n=1 Tax=Guyanagaster necrorhizus TaxID=856835 RepID=A0A9P7W1H7_9AGAR|nr:uncharacterized protein BT62DRAFT_917156 [Guyanagaster necrorhizus MCA 3950]KAG7450887.1 hypothetical protein BT62DRAFT_917156 [Guyanagaster necrorhizus MCA 3950]